MADAIAAMKLDQARKARELAEKCFLAGNLRGARQWMQSAVRLAPALPGTAQIVAAYDVHAAAAAKKKTPDSWYAVLGLQKQKKTGAQALTHDDVKRQHRRLCLLVHPDKNPSAAADGAFKLIQAAWDALSERHPPGAAPPPAKQTPPPPEKQPPPQKPPAPRPAPPPPAAKQAPPPKPKWSPRPRKTPRARRPKPVPRQPSPPPRPRPPPPQPTQTPRQQPTRKKPPPEEGCQSSAAVPPTARRSTAPAENECPACGACTIHGRKVVRCGSCMWSPMDNRPAAYDDDDDYFEEDEDYC
ncbi:unnamed protein product [Urochloa humidicola]